MSKSIAENLARVSDSIAATCARIGRPPGSATLVAVSKRHPPDAIAAAAVVGQRDFGESYAAEMVAKIEASAGHADLRWHFIGHLQRNKVKLVVGRCALIHAVDSEPLLRAIDARAALASLVQPILVAVNLGHEAQKSGVDARELALLLELAARLTSVRCSGLMTMPPLPDQPEDSRPHFRELRRLRDAHATEDQPLDELSMGTTGDLDVALEEGATLVRIGTAIFG